MVGLTAVLARIPVIKFRKGGLGRPSGPSPAAAAAAPAAAPAPAAAAAPSPPQVQPAAAMSTVAIPDIDLPARYRRQPFTEEEIDTINGGGKHNDGLTDSPQKAKTMAYLRIPKGILGQKRKQVMSLYIEKK